MRASLDLAFFQTRRQLQILYRTPPLIRAPTGEAHWQTRASEPLSVAVAHSHGVECRLENSSDRPLHQRSGSTVR